MRTTNLMVDDDGTLYESRRIVPDGEDTDWIKIGHIEDEYEGTPDYYMDYCWLAGEYRDWKRCAGETRQAALQAWERGRF